MSDAPLAVRMAAAEAENARLREALDGVMAVTPQWHCTWCEEKDACAALALRRSPARMRRSPPPKE